MTRLGSHFSIHRYQKYLSPSHISVIQLQNMHIHSSRLSLKSLPKPCIPTLVEHADQFQSQEISKNVSKNHERLVVAKGKASRETSPKARRAQSNPFAKGSSFKNNLHKTRQLEIKNNYVRVSYEFVSIISWKD